MAAKLKLVEFDREQITQKQLEEVEWLREAIRGWKERPEEMGRKWARDFIDQYEFDLAQDERKSRRGARAGRGD